MAKAWSFSGGSQDPVSRAISTLCLDGHRLSTEVTVRFNRNVSATTADSIADEVARAAAEVLGEQISQGEIPMTRTELADKIRARSTAPVNRIVEISVNSLSVVSSNNGLRSTYRSRPSQPNLSAPSIAPEKRPSSSPPSLGPLPSHRDANAPMRMLWQAAWSNFTPGVTADELAMALAAPLRDSTAVATMRSLTSVDPSHLDRLALLGGVEPLPELLRETCSCLAAGMYRVFSASAIDPRITVSVVTGAVRGALAPDDFPVEPLDRYIACGAPVRELAHRSASLLGVPGDALNVQVALSSYCEAVRAELEMVAQEVKRVLRS